VFDLDETLVFTNDLNTRCYNQVLLELGYEQIKNIKRIACANIKTIMPEIDNKTLAIIRDLKQKLFIKNLHEIKPNTELIKILKLKGRNNAVIYTRANIERAKAILRNFDLFDKVCGIVSKSNDIQKDIEKICTILKCDKSKLVFFDDDIELLHNLSEILDRM
jgi:beta-phosphoglucomutase-like phosphatase (HAD superfamily)